jgi:hypothetical protein
MPRLALKPGIVRTQLIIRKDEPHYNCGYSRLPPDGRGGNSSRVPTGIDRRAFK